MRLLAFTIILSLFCGTVTAFQAPTTLPSDRKVDNAKLIEEILWWLPEDTETVIATNGPYDVVRASVRDLERKDSSKKQITPELLEEFFRIGLPFSNEEKRLDETLAGYRIQVTIEGSRAFRSPKRLGLMPFEGCRVIVFDRDVQEIQRNLLPELEQKTPTFLDLDGIRVAGFEEKQEADIWHFYVTFPRPNVLLYATDKTYLAQTLARMKTRAAARALPANLPEWEHLDLAAPFWALRHFRQEGADLDPSSPVSGRHREANAPDVKAIGLVFSFDPRQTDTPTVRYLSGNKRILEIASRSWTDSGQGIKPKCRLVKPGVVQISMPLKDRRVGMFTFMLFTYLGHGLFL